MEVPASPDGLRSVAPDSLDPPSPDQDPSASSTNSDSSSTEDEDQQRRQTYLRLHQIRLDILTRFNLNPPVYRPPRESLQNNIRPRIAKRRRYAAERAWRKDRGIVRDILNGKDPVSVAVPPSPPPPPSWHL